MGTSREFFPDHVSNPELFAMLGNAFKQLALNHTTLPVFKDAEKASYTLAVRLKNKEDKEKGTTKNAD
jgi:hypothetical protein